MQGLWAQVPSPSAGKTGGRSIWNHPQMSWGIISWAETEVWREDGFY